MEKNRQKLTFEMETIHDLESVLSRTKNLLTADAYLDIIMNHMAGAVAVFEVGTNLELETLYISPSFFSSLNQNIKQLDSIKSNFPALVCSEDREGFLTAIRSALDNNSIIDHACRLGETEKTGWRHINAVCIPCEKSDKTLLIALITDISELKSKEEQIRLREEEYRIAIEQSGKNLARYDIKTGTLYQKESYAIPFHDSSIVTDVPESTMEKGIVAAESVEAYRAFYQDMINGKPEGKVILSMKNLLTDNFEWYEGHYTLINDKMGLPTQAIISYVNITLEYERERVQHMLKEQAGADKRDIMLVVDDLQINRGVLTRIFRKDYDILEADGGKAALEFLRRYGKAISIVLLDLMMPDVNGMEVLRSIRSDNELSSVAVIVISAADEISYAIDAIQLGANEYVAMPVEPEIISIRVKNALQKRENDRLRYENSYIAQIKDEEIRHQKELRRMAEHDPLTGLLNREAFSRQVREVLKNAKPDEFIISTTDIDNFKVINDLFGHEEGDKFLKYIAATIQKALKACNGICCRVHADQFGLLLPNDKDILADIAEARKISLSGYPLPFEVLASTGHYIIDEPTMPVDVMLDRAMIARRKTKELYEKKEAYYTPKMRETIIAEQEIIGEMERAIVNGEFDIYLQGQYEYKTGRLSGCEALVRWLHPQKGIILPAAFIKLFEKNGFISRLDQYVFEKTCQLMRRWMDEGLEVVPVSVNLSRLDLYNTKLPEIITDIAGAYRVPHHLLHFEITESAYTDNPEQLIKILSALCEKGFLIEMDDFGSGYSSLNALSDMPVDVLKLDMRFILGSSERKKRSKVLKSIIQMAKDIDLEVIAEGVETMEQAQYLASLGCEYMQGYYYAKPVHSSKFEKLLNPGGRQ